MILGRPTDRSITLSVLSRVAIEAHVEFGTHAGAYPEKTRPRLIDAGDPVELELGGLEPDTRYYYRLLTRPAGGKDYRPEPEGSFCTQRAPGSTFTFAVQGDSHPERQGKMYAPALYALTLQNVAANPPDFYVAMGDDFSIERLIGSKTLSQSAVDQVYAHQRGFLVVVGAAPHCSSSTAITSRLRTPTLMALRTIPPFWPAAPAPASSRCRRRTPSILATPQRFPTWGYARRITAFSGAPSGRRRIARTATA